MSRTRFGTFAWFVLFYNLAVIAWGAFVRISFSGDGCGKNWPLCGGQLIPTSGGVQRLIEGSHRFSSELVGLFVLGMLIWAFRAYPKGHQVRKAAILSGVFTLIEAYLGRELVWYQLVAHNDSVTRAILMSAHLANTLILLACVTVTAISATNPATEGQAIGDDIRFRGQGSILYAIGFGFLCVIGLGISGAISALGHTVHPVSNVLQAAMESGTNYLVRIQPLHPLIATSVGLYVLLLGGLMIHSRPSPKVKEAAQWMVGAFIFQFVLGVVNILLSAPAWMQLVHLFFADIAWITLVIAAATALDVKTPRVDQAELDRAPKAVHKGKPMVSEYIALTKPRVISLLLFTTLTAMYAAHDASHPLPSVWLVLAVAVGGYMAAGAANAINMVIDRDIDATMARTAKRPTVTADISSQNALMFAFFLATGSFAILWAAANLLSALMAFSGLVFYVIVYTMLLKRRTWQNIVIGGAAGCFPPLVGWTAVTNELNPLALLLFGIIFAWTPVHFWALALLLKDDYAAAGVPMLPVVRGDRVTVAQIVMYTILTVIVSALPVVANEAGVIYLIAAVVLNLMLVVRCAQLYRTTARPQASKLFHYSMLYLALLFLGIAVDRVSTTRPSAESKDAQVVSQLRFPGGERVGGSTKEISRMVVNGATL